MKFKYPRPAWAENSPHPFGLLSIYDAEYLENLALSWIVRHRGLSVLEIGVQGGATMLGLAELCEENQVHFMWHGVDLPGCGPMLIPDSVIGTFLGCPSEDAWVQIQRVPFVDFLIMDGCHCSNHVILDFCNYSDFVVLGGLALFHDSINHPKWVGLAHPGSKQSHGPDHPAFGIGVREGLRKLGLHPLKRTDWKFHSEQAQGEVQGFLAFEKL